MEFKIINIIGFIFGVVSAVFCSPTSQVNLCETPECVQCSWDIRKAMDETVAPCDDFYQFACGNFLRETTVTEHQYSVDLSNIRNIIIKDLEVLLKEERTKNDPKHFWLPNAFYRACMNTTLIEKLGSKPVEEIVNSVGGWPVVMGSNWNADETWNWQEVMKKLYEAGFSSHTLFISYLGDVNENSTRQIPVINVPSYFFSLLEKNETEKGKYFMLMVKTAVEFGADRELAESDVENVFQFEIDVAKLLNTSEAGYQDPIVMTVENFHYLNAFLPENVKILVFYAEFFKKLETLLRNTPKRTLANFIMWRIHQESSYYLSENFRSLEEGMYSREEQCVEETAQKFKTSVGSLYAQRYLNLNVKKAANDLFENIRGAFTKILSKTKWIDNVTKKNAHEKLSKLKAVIGYPEEYLDNEKLAEFYRGIEIDADKFFESHLKMEIFKRKLIFDFERTLWNEFPIFSYSGVFYQNRKDLVGIPTGIFRGRYFNLNRPNYLNYGALGTIIGHEMPDVINWWQFGSEKEYLSKVDCMIKQYRSYLKNTTELDFGGIGAFSRSVAYNGGVKVSYMAYKKWANTNGLEAKLPGLDFNPEQMFWIAAAQNYCRKYSNGSFLAKKGLENWPKYKVLGVLKNTKDFAKDFNCPLNSAMNPAEKCEIW